MDILELIDNIYSGGYDKGLDKLSNAIAERREMLSHKLYAELNPGDRVRFISQVRPRYLQGVEATVVNFLNTRIRVRLDHPVGKFHSTIITSPKLLEKVIK